MLNSGNIFILSHLLSPYFIFDLLNPGVHISLWSSRISISGAVMRSGKTSLPLVGECLANNLLYNPKTGRCVDYRCEAPVCDETKLPNGDFSCDAHNDGDTCTVSCKDGYISDYI